jgi:hypothetical protein
LLRLVGLTAFMVAAFLALTVGSASAATVNPKIGEITGPEAGVSFESLKSESVAVNDHNGHIFVADSAAEACPNEGLRVENNSLALGCRAYEQDTLPLTTSAQPTTNAGASFPPAMTASGTGLLPPRNSTAPNFNRKQRSSQLAA